MTRTSRSGGIAASAPQRSIKVAVLRAAITVLVAASLTEAVTDNECARIFTMEMAQQVLGSPVTPGDKNSKADITNGPIVVSQCSYSVAKGEKRLNVGLTLRRAATVDEARNTFLGSKKIYSGQDVAGLGDLAYRTAAPAQLNVLKGRNWLIISAGTFPVADVSLQEKAAREILKTAQD